MSADRELLELAAKAAGIPLCIWGAKGKESFADMSEPSSHKRWNPLTDDGDALRMAVKLLIDTEFSDDQLWVTAEDAGVMKHEFFDDDPFAATRRAIVRAAAEIGRSLP